MEKRKYEQPTIEIVELDVEDIITTSGKTTKTFNPEGWSMNDVDDNWFGSN